jgi:predicted HTH transcriptional regulator
MQAISSKKKSLNEEFVKFFENPTREGFRELLKNNFGELPNLDFKEEWPTLSKVARHILGMANLGGGAIIVGVAELSDKMLEPKGIATIIDKADIVKGVKKFLPEPLLSNLPILDFSYDASEYGKLVGKRFQVILVEDDPKHLPFVAMASGDGIRETAIYVRRGTSTEEANHEELQRIINRRLDTGHSSQVEMDLQTHIEQLKILFKHIDKHRVLVKGGIFQSMGEALAKSPDFQSILGQRELVDNKLYPKEDFESFIARMIEKKKRRIEIELDVVGMSYDNA